MEEYSCYGCGCTFETETPAMGPTDEEDMPFCAECVTAFIEYANRIYGNKSQRYIAGQSYAHGCFRITILGGEHVVWTRTNLEALSRHLSTTASYYVNDDKNITVFP